MTPAENARAYINQGWSPLLAAINAAADAGMSPSEAERLIHVITGKPYEMDAPPMPIKLEPAPGTVWARVNAEEAKAAVSASKRETSGWRPVPRMTDERPRGARTGWLPWIRTFHGA
jgi:hypothetical protein